MIRQMTGSDAEEVSSLVCECQRFIAVPDGYSLVAFGGCHIEELFVLPSQHRRGVGAALFSHAEQLVRDAGHCRMTVTTTGYGHPFYEAMGMQIVGSKRVAFGPLEGRELVLLEKALQ